MIILNRIVPNTTLLGLILILFIINNLFISCDIEKKEVLCNPKPAYCIEFIDTDSVCVVGLNKLYNPDSIYYEINSVKNKAGTSNDYVNLPLGFDTLNAKDFYIILNSVDKDTLRLTIENGPNECGKYSEIPEFYFNGKLITEKSRIYKIIK
jgi:hypothetical protein